MKTVRGHLEASVLERLRANRSRGENTSLLLVGEPLYKHRKILEEVVVARLDQT